MGSASGIRVFMRADDLGSARSANRAIRETFEKGQLRNTSAMFCTPHIEDAAELLAAEKGLCVGLHMTMNAEWDHVRWGPVLPPEQVRSLVDEKGHFLQNPKLLHDRGGVKESEIFAELQAQLDRGRNLGFTVTYADSHMGWTWIIPGLGDRIANWCRKEGLINRESDFCKLPKIEGAKDLVEDLIEKLKLAAPGDYMIVGHPAYDDAEMRTLGHAGYSGEKVASGRHWERLRFMDDRILRFFNERGIASLRFDER